MTPTDALAWSTWDDKHRFIQALDYLKAPEVPDSTHTAVELSELPLYVNLQRVLPMPKKREIRLFVVWGEAQSELAQSGCYSPECTDPFPIDHLRSAFAETESEESEFWTDEEWGWTEPTMPSGLVMKASDTITMDAETERRLLDSGRALEQMTGVTEEDYIEY